MEKFTDRVNESVGKKVFIEPVASASDFHHSSGSCNCR